MKKYSLLLLLSFLITMPFLGRGLFESSEGRYAMVAKNMVESGDYWIPKINGHIHLTKPPLTYWMIALGQKIFGFTTFGSRIIHAVLWLVMSLIMLRIGDLITDGKKGFIIALIFCTSLFPALGSWFLTTDAILVLFQAISFWSLLEFRKQKKSVWVYVFWIGLGLAFNTKGPVALFPVIIWAIFMGKVLKEMFRLLPVMTFIFVSCFWYIGLEISQPGILFRLFQDEIIKRSTTDFSGRNAFWWAPIVTYVIPLIIGWGLWPFFINKQNASEILKNRDTKFSIFWIVSTVIVFSLIKSRLVLYVLPLSIPFAILIGQMIEEKKLMKALSINLLLLITLKTAATILPYDNNAKQIAQFTETSLKGEKVIFINEYLYGVEYYLGSKFGRYSTIWGIYEALERKEEVRYVAIQEKRIKVFKEITQRFSKKIIPYSKSGKWNIFELRDNVEITSEHHPSEKQF